MEVIYEGLLSEKDNTYCNYDNWCGCDGYEPPDCGCNDTDP